MVYQVGITINHNSMEKNKGFAPLILVIIIVAVLAVAGGGYLLLKKEKQTLSEQGSVEETSDAKEQEGIMQKDAQEKIPTPPDKPSPPSKPTTSVSEKSDALRNWQVYQNQEYGFQIKYPPNYIKEDKKGLNQIFIIFGPKEEGKGRPLSIIVVTDPNKSYEEALEEFRKDIGSKLQERPRNVAGINGREFKGEGIIFVIIPHKGRPLGFSTAATNQTAFEKEAIPLFDLFVSSFAPIGEIPKWPQICMVIFVDGKKIRTFCKNEVK